MHWRIARDEFAQARELFNDALFEDTSGDWQRMTSKRDLVIVRH